MRKELWNGLFLTDLIDELLSYDMHAPLHKLCVNNRLTPWTTIKYNIQIYKIYNS